MSGWILRFIIIAAIGFAISWGIRKIWRDWTGQFRDLDKQQRQRDLRERQQPGVIDLERDKDGTFRPPEK